MCDEWKDSYENFKRDVGKKPSKDYSIDRINNNGNYEPSNIRWATRKQQANNKRNVKILEYNGEYHTIPEWSEIIGIDKDTIKQRINKLGWSIEDALSKPVEIHIRGEK